MRTLAQHTARQHGMSLIEVLVALVVLSVGMLGIAVMFVQSVRSSRTAILRTQAVNLVSDMADRIRANANAQEAYDTDNYGGGPQFQSCAPDPDGLISINCNPAQLAEDDLARWQRSVREGRTALPELKEGPAEAEVHYIAPAAEGQPERYRIRVAWREPNESRNAAANSEQLYSYQSDVVLLPRAAVP